MKRFALGIMILSSLTTNALTYIPKSPSFKGEIIQKHKITIKPTKLEQIQKQIKNQRDKIKENKKTKAIHKKIHHHPSKKGIDKTFILSFYTSLPEENGGNTTTCKGKPLKYGLVASNVYPIGTKIYLKGYGTFTVGDKGGSHFNNDNRLDVLIEKLPGESNSHYINRVNNMGKPVVKGIILK